MCIRDSKYHTDARNLLGLIFYEMGETSDALTQWVISINLQPENNRADHYLDEVQRKPGQLEIASQTIKKYNQALFHAQGGSDDQMCIRDRYGAVASDKAVPQQLLCVIHGVPHCDRRAVEGMVADGMGNGFHRIHIADIVDGQPHCFVDP